MATRVTLTIAGEHFEAELNSSPPAEKLLAMLPLKIPMTRWGDEYYGGCGIEESLDDTSRDILEIGELAFWPPGSALCIFFGPTPASTDSRPRAASDVVPVGRITSGVEKLKSFGGSIVVEISG